MMSTKTLSFARAVALLAFALFGPGLMGGCSSDKPSGPGDARHELAAHRGLWAAAGLKDYELRLARSCFCSPELTNPLDVRVSGGNVVEVWRDPGHQPLDTWYGMTVDDLFGRIADALDETGATLEVRYNGNFGYPEEISIARPGVADGYWGATAELLCRRAGEDSAAACDCSGAPDTRPYRFTARDHGGVEIVVGCLGLVFTESPSLSVPELISGRRCLRPTCTLEVPPAFPGAWTVAGDVSQFGEITLDLNSGIADFNIFLTGRFDAPAGDHGDFSGDWSYSTIAGPQATGRFTAIRVP